MDFRFAPQVDTCTSSTAQGRRRGWEIRGREIGMEMGQIGGKIGNETGPFPMFWRSLPRSSKIQIVFKPEARVDLASENIAGNVPIVRFPPFPKLQQVFQWRQSNSAAKSGAKFR